MQVLFNAQRSVRRSIALGFATLLIALGTVGATQAQDAFAGGCNAGLWGSVWAWGDCRGIGAKKWALKVSCTWGASATSGTLTGDGHVDVKCPLGSSRAASIIFR